MIEIQGTAILRDGDEIGTIEGDTAFLGKKPGPNILGQIRKAAGKPELAFSYEAKSIAPVVQSAQTANNEGESISGKPAGVSGAAVAPEVSGNSDANASPKTALDRLLDLVAEGHIPAPPAHNPAAGDKCPAFRAWFQTHATLEEYEAKYPAKRKLPQTAQDITNGIKPRKIAGEVPDTAD